MRGFNFKHIRKKLQSRYVVGSFKKTLINKYIACFMFYHFNNLFGHLELYCDKVIQQLVSLVVYLKSPLTLTQPTGQSGACQR